jgi:hypothetical protein
LPGTAVLHEMLLMRAIPATAKSLADFQRISHSAKERHASVLPIANRPVRG